MILIMHGEAGLVEQLEVGFVDEGHGVERLAGPEAAQLPMRHHA